MVFLLAGVKERWKLPLGYDLTENSFNHAFMARRIKTIIRLCLKKGIKIRSLVMDGGSQNRTLQRELGIKFSYSDGEQVNCFFVDGMRVCVFSDVCHILKNIRNAFAANDFKLDDDTVRREKLSSPYAKWEHLKMLHDFQKDKQHKLQPGITDKTFDLGPFAKMNVGPAVNAFSKPTADVLDFCVDHHNFPHEVKTTAFFIRMIAGWWDLMSSRSSRFCFTLEEKGNYEANIQTLMDFMEFFDKCEQMKKNGDKEQYIQSNVMLTTTSMIMQVEYYLKERGMKFVLGGRFTSDCVENFFSQIRKRVSAPTALQFKYAFRALLLLNHMKPSKKGAYLEDDHCNQWLTELDHIRQLKLDQEDEDINVYDILVGDKEMKDFDQENALRYLIGYLLKKTICAYGQSKCSKCEEVFTMDHCLATSTELLIMQRCYTPDALCMPTEYAYKIFSMIEQTFLLNVSNMNKKGYFDSLIEKLSTTTMNLFKEDLPTCHWDLLLRRFLKIRMIFWTRQRSHELMHVAATKAASNGSKSVAAQQL